MKALAAESNANAQESMSKVQKNQTASGLDEAKTAEIVEGIKLDRFRVIADAIDKRQERQVQIPRLALTGR